MVAPIEAPYSFPSQKTNAGVSSDGVDENDCMSDFTCMRAVSCSDEGGDIKPESSFEQAQIAHIAIIMYKSRFILFYRVYYYFLISSVGPVAYCL